MRSGVVRQGGLERFRCALETRLDARQHAQVLTWPRRWRLQRLPGRRRAREFERNGDHRELPLVIYGQRRHRRLETRQGAERHLSSCGAERHLGAHCPLSRRAAAGPLAAASPEGRLSARCKAQTNVVQIAQAVSELRFDFQYHMILVRLREDRGDLPLAKGIISVSSMVCGGCRSAMPYRGR